MTAPLTDDELAQIEAREQAATEGPWLHDHEEVSWPNRVWADGGIDPYGEANDDYVLAFNIVHPDAEFIAHARTDVPRLLAEVNRLRDENDRLRVMWDRSGKNDLIEQRDKALAEVERLRAAEAAVQAVLRLAGQHATAAYARGDSEERRRWLDLFITIERAGYPTETKEDER